MKRYRIRKGSFLDKSAGLLVLGMVVTFMGLACGLVGVM